MTNFKQMKARVHITNSARNLCHIKYVVFTQQVFLSTFGSVFWNYIIASKNMHSVKERILSQQSAVMFWSVWMCLRSFMARFSYESEKQSHGFNNIKSYPNTLICDMWAPYHAEMWDLNYATCCSLFLTEEIKRSSLLIRSVTKAEDCILRRLECNQCSNKRRWKAIHDTLRWASSVMRTKCSTWANKTCSASHL